MGVFHLEAYFKICHTFFSCLWGQYSGSCQGDGFFSSFVSIFTGPHDRIYDIEAVEIRRQSVESKWLSHQRQYSKAYNQN